MQSNRQEDSSATPTVRPHGQCTDVKTAVLTDEQSAAIVAAGGAQVDVGLPPGVPWPKQVYPEKLTKL
jgi:hypothetical protein